MLKIFYFHYKKRCFIPRIIKYCIIKENDVFFSSQNTIFHTLRGECCHMTISNLSLLSNKLLLYVVSPSLVAEYKEIAEQNMHIITGNVPNALDRINIFTPVCDIWIALKSYDEPIVLDQNKCMNFPPAALQLKLIEENAALKSFLHTEQLSPAQQFVLSYFISVETMGWINRIMDGIGRSDLVQHYRHEILYFELLEYIDEETFLNEMNTQTIFVKTMMQNVRETNEFHFAITSAMSKMKDLLKLRV